MLSRSDYDDISMLINISTSIYRSFQKLCSMEIKREKESSEYQKLLEEVDGDLSLKDNIMNRIATSPEKSLEIINYLKTSPRFKNSKLTSTPTLSFVACFNDLSENDAVLAYLLNQLVKIAIENPSFLLSQGIDEMELPEEVLKEKKDFYAFQTSFQVFLTMDLYNLVLALNENRVNNAQNLNIKERSIKTKYKLGFLIPDIFKDLIKNKFNAQLHPYLIHNTASRIYPVDPDFEAFLKNKILIDETKKILTILSTYSDYDLINPDNMASALNYKDLLRSTLILADEETSAQIFDIIKKFLEECDKHKTYLETRLISDILKDVLNNFQEDKTIPQIISFGRI